MVTCRLHGQVPSSLLGCHLSDWRQPEYTESSLSTVNKPIWADCGVSYHHAGSVNRKTSDNTLGGCCIKNTSAAPVPGWHGGNLTLPKARCSKKDCREFRGCCPFASIRSCAWGLGYFCLLSVHSPQLLSLIQTIPCKLYRWTSVEKTNRTPLNYVNWTYAAFLIFFPVTVRASFNFSRKTAIIFACLDVSCCSHAIGWVHI